MRRFLVALLSACACAVALAAPVEAREVVPFADPRFLPGTVIVRTGERKLYIVTGQGQAIRYTVAVGKAGKQWQGVKYVDEMQMHPAWSPPASVKRDRPGIPNVIAGGAPNNPMGARVIGLGPSGQYAIHGTNLPTSVGTAASYGCFRMHNADVIDLYTRVRMGTTVVVMQ